MLKKVSLIVLMIVLMIVLGVQVLHRGKGKIRVASDKQEAYVYVNGKKKAMTGEGFSSILLEEGEYTVKVAKAINEYFEYVQSKQVFVGEDTSVKLNFTLKQEMTAKGKALQVKKDVSKLSRWQRDGEVVIDTKLGLAWQDNSAVVNTKMRWKVAKKYCQSLSMEGYNDWRLPSYDKLLTIVDYDKHDPTIMPSFENVNTSDFYWSSSVHVSDSKSAWYVDFEDGRTFYHIKTNEYYVRCVRGRQ